METILEHNMAPLYEELCQELSWDLDSSLLERMRAANTARLEELDAAVRDAEENSGETEIRDALSAKAHYLADIGDRDAAREAFAATAAKTAGAGPKMDLAFAQLRLLMASGDWSAVKSDLEHATALCASGGDWERKNRLRVYEAVYLLSTRQFKRAAELFLESIATFTATELMTYPRCIFYTVLLAVAALDRPTLRSRVVASPEVLSVMDQIPHLQEFLNSLDKCRYAEFMNAFAALTDAVRSDRYLYPHFR
jgi:26S proteasome regulatory subunit N7